MINGEDPDLLSLQEVGDDQAVNDLKALLNGSWYQQVSTLPDVRGIRVAWLSRHPIADSEEISAFPAKLQPVQQDDQGGTSNAMGRGGLAITVTIDGVTIHAATAHLKSKLLTFPGGRFSTKDEGLRARYGAYALYRRTGEAVTMRAWVTAKLQSIGANEAVILTGDLNDTPLAATTQILQGPPGSEFNTGGFGHPDAGDAQRMWNVAPLMPAGHDYSRVFEGRHELIDHVFLSHKLTQPTPQAEALVATPPPSITTDPTARQGKPASDHAPVVATI
jgi:endonuclease/exonuclease/phosphatase family metal-dependent hydrolase